MTIRLYHCKGARSVRPLWCMEEMGIGYELESMPFPPRVFHKQFKEVNPLGTVPYFLESEADDILADPAAVRMTESCAICHYLVTKHGPSDLAVSPSEPDYAAFLNWLYHADATITFPQTVQIRYTIVEPEERRLPQAVEDYKGFFLGRLRMLDATLADGRQYLCAGRFTIADIAVSYAVYLAGTLGTTEAMTDNIRPWYERVTDRPAFKKAIEL